MHASAIEFYYIPINVHKIVNICRAPLSSPQLTRLLEDSLGNNAKCVLIANVSPATENTSETKCSLEFASRARKVELGRARQNIDGAGGPPSTPPASRPMSGRATPTGEAAMSRSSSRDALSSATRLNTTPGRSMLSK